MWYETVHGKLTNVSLFVSSIYSTVPVRISTDIPFISYGGPLSRVDRSRSVAGAQCSVRLCTSMHVRVCQGHPRIVRQVNPSGRKIGCGCTKAIVGGFLRLSFSANSILIPSFSSLTLHPRVMQYIIGQGRPRIFGFHPYLTSVSPVLGTSCIRSTSLFRSEKTCMSHCPSFVTPLPLTRSRLEPRSRYTLITKTLTVHRTYRNVYRQYYWVALATLLFYDYFLTLRDEVRILFG